MHGESDFRGADGESFSRPGRSNNHYAAKRDATTLAITNDHEVFADDLVDLGIFRNVPKALKRLSVLERRKRVRRVGFIKSGNRLKTLWAGFHVPVSKLEHNHVLSLLAFRINGHELRRGSQVDPRWEFDIEVSIDGTLVFAVEFDNSQERMAQVERRMRKVASSPVDVLWVVRTEQRRQRFLELAGAVAADRFLVALLDDAMADFHGPIWHAPDGSVVAIDGVPNDQTWLAAICQPLR